MQKIAFKFLSTKCFDCNISSASSAESRSVDPHWNPSHWDHAKATQQTSHSERSHQPEVFPTHFYNFLYGRRSSFCFKPDSRKTSFVWGSPWFHCCAWRIECCTSQGCSQPSCFQKLASKGKLKLDESSSTEDEIMRSSVACAFWKAWAMQRLTKVKPTEKTAYLVGSHGTSTLAAKLQGRRQSKNAIMWLRKVYPATRDVLDVAIATAPPQSSH